MRHFANQMTFKHRARDLEALLDIASLLYGCAHFAELDLPDFDDVLALGDKAEKIESKTELAKLALWIFRYRAFKVCVAMQELRLPALLSLAIIDELMPNTYRMHFGWQIVTAVKHFEH